MKEIITEEELRKADNSKKANILKRITQGQAIYEKSEKEKKHGSNSKGNKKRGVWINTKN